MRMAWWMFMAFLTLQIILVQYMAEAYLAGHMDMLPYYAGALALVLILAWFMYAYFRYLDDSKE